MQLQGEGHYCGAMNDKPVVTVSEVTELIKDLLETSLPDLAIEGELSNWRPAPSGHVYCTLKDRNAMLQAVMFKGKAMRLAFKPADGMLVRVSGSISVYAARGQYQLIIDTMEKAGAGDIQARLDELKKRLSAEGLFDLSRKKTIPAFPSSVVVITSPTGAAIRDILNVLGRRNAGMRITILPAVVQGADAPDALVRQIKTANAFGMGEVIIIGRGGGSLEDLLAFSDEALVRAVADSSIPVISAVGHEIDWSLCDHAADLRAATPSAAAELVSESASAVRVRAANSENALIGEIKSRLRHARMLIQGFSSEALALKLERNLQPYRQRMDYSREALLYGIQSSKTRTANRLAQAGAILAAADPASILARGFAVVHKQGEAGAIRNCSELSRNDAISIQFAVGKASAIIKESST